MATDVQGLPALTTSNTELLNQNSIEKTSEIKTNLSDTLSNNIKTINKEANSKDNEISKNAPDYTRLADEIKASLKSNDTSIQFTMDKDTKRMVMRLINNDTKEVIQQYPPEITLKISRMIASLTERGIVTNAKV